MKIFAKRTRKLLDAESAEKLKAEQEAAKLRDGEKAIQELLKQDPSTLNSKQRRIVKRYRQRHGDTVNDTVENNTEDRATPESETTKEPATPSNKECEATPTDTLATEKECVSRDVRDIPTAEKDADEGHHDGDVSEPANSDGLDEEQVKKTLEGLNSKQRRKLMRRLEREGSNALLDIHEEAQRLLAETKTDVKVDDGAALTEATVKTPPSKGKKRKKDWGDLPPEERLRREEQRRMQKEAAERRATTEGNSANKRHRHPLNSERRRANRRKPKWQRQGGAEIDHNSSGYHMRKLART